MKDLYAMIYQLFDNMPSVRGIGIRTFGKDVLVEFLQFNGLERMIRGDSVL